jgi:hypothetical protein
MMDSEPGIAKLESVLISDPTESSTNDADRSSVFALRKLARPMTTRAKTHAISLWPELLV